ncbi:hypothetical protein AMK06_CH02287 [Rhizobium sp. N541]|uniref:hypothetical protein n=1 Tax=unclassified Rhizobium TaxID=2613769 RepID=UPI0007F0B105|nr:MULTISPECIES: hypothetical protein [unclassified Rhizobium]ANM17181.1 hypothetical protein AMK06_CH02287 [Rhizobium sp. N541]ANM23566.1 hypothetical protein AMK07_CH02284 [Rhizobium sp. N941]
MKLKLMLGLLAALPLAACGTVTLPAAVKMNDGQALMGTTTAAVSGGTFQVATPKGDISCSGNYDAFDTSPVTSAPVHCSDGRYGTITVLRSPDGVSGAGAVSLADGAKGNLAFGRAAPTVLAAEDNALPLAPTTLASVSPGSEMSTPAYEGSSTYAPSTRVYTSNSPTPESLDAAGHRCGARSAASRPGGVDGYLSGARPAPRYGGSVYVRGYYRKNGTYVPATHVVVKGASGERLKNA